MRSGSTFPRPSSKAEKWWPRAPIRMSCSRPTIVRCTTRPLLAPSNSQGTDLCNMINIDKDNTLLTAGVWMEYEGSKFLVTHMSNVAFQRAVMRRQAPHKSKIDKGTLDPALMREMMTRAMAEALVLDWDNVVD